MKVFTTILIVYSVATASAHLLLRGADTRLLKKSSKAPIKQKNVENTPKSDENSNENIPNCQVGECRKSDGTCSTMAHCFRDPCEELYNEQSRTWIPACGVGKTCTPDYCGGCGKICTDENIPVR